MFYKIRSSHVFVFRSLPYTYRGNTSYEGIPLKEFTVPPYAYANPSEYPGNAGFCLSEPCPPTGILDVSSCAQGMFMKVLRMVQHQRRLKFRGIEKLKRQIMKTIEKKIK